MQRIPFKPALNILTFAFIIQFTVLSTLNASEHMIKGQKFTLPDGFEITEIADPSLVKRPICADFDEEGRLYVADSSGSNEKVNVQLDKKPHRIVRLEDTNNDGQFDKSIVFADKMMFPEGALWHDGSLYVAAPPQIWKLTDTNEDGVADKREIWFDGKTLTGCANDLHGPYLGPDGWIYWCKGAFAEQKYQRIDGTELVTKAAHIFRRRPEGGIIEPVMTGGMDNPVEVIFTPGGERIFSTTFLVRPGGGFRDGLIHAIYGGVYGKPNRVLDKHPRTGPMMPVLTHMGAAAPCGLLSIETNQLGQDFQHNVLTCSFNMHKITRTVLEPTGATFSTKTEDFLVCDNLDFHPTDILEDADGSLIVIDTGGWYKLCCPTSQLHKPDILGAIYRIKRTGSHKLNDPHGHDINWTAQSPSQLINLLADSRSAVRKIAKNKLTKNGVESISELQKSLASSNNNQLRLQAVWTLTQIDHPEARKAVRLAVNDQDETVRQAALHSISVHRDKLAEKVLVRVLKEKSEHNRRAAAEALGRIGTPQSIPAILSATAHASDRALEHSLIYAAMEIGDSRIIRNELNSPLSKVKRAALIALDQIKGDHLKPSDIVPLLSSSDPILNQTAWWIANHHLDNQWVTQYATYFIKELSKSQKDKESLAQISSRLARFARNPAIQQVMADSLAGKLATNMETRIAVLNAMTSSGMKEIPIVWKKVLLKQLETSDPKLLQASVSAIHSLSAAKPDQIFVNRLNEIAQNPERATSVRLEALAALPPSKRSFSSDIINFLCENLSPDQPVNIRSLAVDVIASTPLNNAQMIHVADASKIAGPMELRRLMEMFEKSKNKQVGEHLVIALSSNPSLTSLSASNLKKQLSGFGENVIRQSKNLIEIIEKENADKIRKIDEVLELVSKGDIRRGQQIFHSTKTSCIACHGMGYLGGRIGPDLTRIGSIRTERDLLEAILFPSTSFVRSYEPVQIMTVDGKIYNGLMRDETDEEIHLQLDAEKSVRIKKEDIEEQLAGEISIMPKGLVKEHTIQELADLVVFLKASK